MSLLPKLGAILLPNIGGWAGGIITSSQIKPWYEGLKKPEWRPPNWVFGPVWTALYSGIGYASYLVYQSGGGFDGSARVPLMLYGSQLVLNWIWSPIFFGAHSLKWGLVDTCALYVNAAVCGLSFYKINSLAGYLFIPYLLWLTLATGLSGLVDICALYVNAAVCGLSFYKINSLAGYFFIPYLVWLTLATGLNVRIYLDNPEEPKITEIKDN